METLTGIPEIETYRFSDRAIRAIGHVSIGEFLSGIGEKGRKITVAAYLSTERLDKITGSADTEPCLVVSDGEFIRVNIGKGNVTYVDIKGGTYVGWVSGKCSPEHPFRYTIKTTLKPSDIVSILKNPELEGLRISQMFS
ncbi:MAG: hypothetical protein M1268_02030 [Patescibacteria group bacterium]|nr:hypothetical protein [Patescibacteria group bacterium]